MGERQIRSNVFYYKDINLFTHKLMISRETLQEIASNVQIFQKVEQKERFLFVVGALVSRVISLKKAAEIMELDVEVFLQILELMGIEFSYLTLEDVALEKSW
jgi:predicted HTH domain antitoxin